MVLIQKSTLVISFAKISRPDFAGLFYVWVSLFWGAVGKLPNNCIQFVRNNGFAYMRIHSCLYAAFNVFFLRICRYGDNGDVFCVSLRSFGI